jgi:non-canonical poly(A) RNA polymerase PAPD5/7
MKIINLEKEKEDLNEKIINLEKEKEILNQNIIQIKEEYSELNQKMEKMIKDKENEKINKNPNIQIIKTNPSYYSQYLNKKFTHFNYEKDYMLDSLSSDLLDFENFVKMRIEKEKDIYDTLIKNVQISVDNSINNYEVNLYGSHATNLCLPWSDLDVVLIKKKDENIIKDNNNNLMLLSKLYEYIKNEPWVKECKLISKAAVPIIKLVSIEKYNNMSIDISIQDDKHFGLKCVDLVKQFINDYKSLKPLVLAIKNILKRANLNDPYKGGISSYGLILMIVFFLQKQKSTGIDISPGDNNCNLGKLFFEFIKFYAIFFESNKVIINLNDNSNNNRNIYNEFEYNNMGHTPDLIIVDPLNHYNNVAKSCLQFFNIKMSFIICLMTLQEDCECGCHFNQLGENYDNLKEEHCFLKRIFNSVKRFC